MNGIAACLRDALSMFRVGARKTRQPWPKEQGRHSGVSASASASMADRAMVFRMPFRCARPVEFVAVRDTAQPCGPALAASAGRSPTRHAGVTYWLRYRCAARRCRPHASSQASRSSSSSTVSLPISTFPRFVRSFATAQLPPFQPPQCIVSHANALGWLGRLHCATIAFPPVHFQTCRYPGPAWHDACTGRSPAWVRQPADTAWH